MFIFFIVLFPNGKCNIVPWEVWQAKRLQVFLRFSNKKAHGNVDLSASGTSQSFDV